MGIFMYFAGVFFSIGLKVVVVVNWLTKPIKFWNILFYISLVFLAFSYASDIHVSKWGPNYNRTFIETIELYICLSIAFLSFLRIISGVLATHLRKKNGRG
jgi:hypothetical protein